MNRGERRGDGAAWRPAVGEGRGDERPPDDFYYALLGQLVHNRGGTSESRPSSSPKLQSDIFLSGPRPCLLTL